MKISHILQYFDYFGKQITYLYFNFSGLSKNQPQQWYKVTVIGMLLFSTIVAALHWIGVSCYKANISRNETYRKALFVKRLEHHKIVGTPLESKQGLTYDQCTVKCLRHTDCKSFNYESVEPFTCEILDRMIFDVNTYDAYKENWSNFDPGPVLLPCLARKYGMPDPLNHTIYKEGLKDFNEDSLCDMKTDEGKNIFFK